MFPNVGDNRGLGKFTNKSECNYSCASGKKKVYTFDLLTHIIRYLRANQEFGIKK